MTDITTFGNLKASYHTFGCKLNFSETSTIANELEKLGIRRVQRGESPDIMVVNTCSVTETADRKCRQTIRSLSRRYPKAAIFVTGCYAQLKPYEVENIPGVVFVAGNDRKLRLPEYICTWLESHHKATDVVPGREFRTFMPSCSRGDRTRYFLKVQDGCDYYCSYCTIPFARGRSRSGTVTQMVELAHAAADEGGKEIVITGVNIGDFGKGGEETFLDLVKALDDVDGIERYRISSIEPNLLTDEIIDFTASSKRFMPHFHIPLQSGDNEMLALMRRHYDTELFRHKTEAIRRAMPHAFIGVDLIVGARGETPERFESSKAFVESLPISKLHVFTYSERPGTRALDIPYIVPPEERHRRTRIMLEISEKKLENFALGFKNTVRPVLLEHSKPGKPIGGFTDNYLKVETDAPAETDNTIANVRITEVLPGGETVKGIIEK